MNTPLKYSAFLGILLLLFLTYNIFLYTDEYAYGTIRLSKQAQQGETIWLQNNCNSCHQIYGLGGYLGPDLTNEYSRIKNDKLLKALFNSGIKAMPQFNFNANECSSLIQFLKEVDKTGYYPNPKATIQPTGWVTLKYKGLEYEK
ncbi:MAG: c-type cytochrome [Flavobacterium psychrophilum]